MFTYIVPILRDVTHGSTGYVTAMLMLFGVGATIGNGVGGRLADRSVDRALMLMLAIMALTLLAFTVLMQWPVTAAIAILIWASPASRSCRPCRCGYGRRLGRAEPRLRDEHRAFNLGNAIGAALGGGVIGAGWGCRSCR